MTDIIWVIVCNKCGVLYGTKNGAFAQAFAKSHKKDNKEHIVYLGSEIRGE